MGNSTVLPTAFEAMAMLPPGHDVVSAVFVESVDAGRSRLSVSVPDGSMLDAALYGRPGWFREPTPHRGRHGKASRTYWRWVRPEPDAVPSTNREDGTARSA